MKEIDFSFARGIALRNAVDTVLDAIDGIPPTAPCADSPAHLERDVVQQLYGITHGDGVGVRAALSLVLGVAARGAANPASPHCIAHLHCAPSAVAAAADLGVSILNQSMDSWDQSPAASAIEMLTARVLSEFLYPGLTGSEVLFTGGATESTLVALLAAREKYGESLTLVMGSNAHHSVGRAAWMLGYKDVITVPADGGRLSGSNVASALHSIKSPTVVVATAGTTDHGLIDDLVGIVEAAEGTNAWLHLDAAYGGLLLLSDTNRAMLASHERYDSIALDMHKLGWQPVAAGVVGFKDSIDTAPLHLSADYLNAPDDTEHGMPDMLGRSIRTSRRADAVRMYACLAATGTAGLGKIVDRCVEAAGLLHRLLEDDERFEVAMTEPGITTVIFRPAKLQAVASERFSSEVAALRRELAVRGDVILGRSSAPGDPTKQCWLKATVLNPGMSESDIRTMLDTIEKRWENRESWCM